MFAELELQKLALLGRSLKKERDFLSVNKTSPEIKFRRIIKSIFSGIRRAKGTHEEREGVLEKIIDVVAVKPMDFLFLVFLSTLFFTLRENIGVEKNNPNLVTKVFMRSGIGIENTIRFAFTNDKAYQRGYYLFGVVMALISLYQDSIK